MRELLTVPGVPKAVPSVRRHVRELLAGHPAIDDTLLCLAELMSNAIRHTDSGRGGKIRVELAAAGAYMRVRVTDDGGSLSRPHIPDHAAGSGRGLKLVDGLAADWGVSQAGARTTVWFALGN